MLSSSSTHKVSTNGAAHNILYTYLITLLLLIDLLLKDKQLCG